MAEPIKIVIVGNGFGGTYALKNLHKFFHKNTGVELTLVGDKNYFLFTPLLHEVATGGINPENIIEPIRKVLKCCLRNFYLAKVESINTKEKTIKAGDFVIPYDYLVLAPGAETNFYDTPGAAEHSLTLKSIEDAVKIKNHCVAQMEIAAHTRDEEVRKRLARFVIVGGGPSGVELAAEMHEFIKDSFYESYPAEVVRDASVVLIQRAPELIPQFNKKMREQSLRVLRKKGVEVRLNSAVKEVTGESVILADGTNIPTETVIWVAGIKPAELKFDTEIKQSADKKLMVDNSLALQEHKEIFVLGDAAMLMQKNEAGVEAPIPALAQVAEKEAKLVAENIWRSIVGKPLKPFWYKSTGSMISIGQWMAIGEIAHITFWGWITWWLWRTVYLSKLISWRKKVRVAFDWTLDIFSSRDISQI